jgi:predicted transcriptional regulator
MFRRLIQFLSLGCHHRRISKVFTAAQQSSNSSPADWEDFNNQSAAGHYVVCLECGKKFAYDWSQMKMIR